MKAYIEIVGAETLTRRELEWGLGFIEFTRENVLAWMEEQTNTDWVGIHPIEDFHAVCGDIEIPWATEEARLLWARFPEHVPQTSNR